MFSFAQPAPRRRMSLTPMIDVVFLLLVFFMLVARFGTDRALPLQTAGGEGAYSGPPRLVEVLPEGLTLNGVGMARRAVLTELVRLTKSGEDVVVVRPAEATSLQRLIEAMDLLRRAGFSNLAIAEARR